MYELADGRLVWREAPEEAKAAPTFMRHDPDNGKRYAEPVQVLFEDRRFTPGRKPSPDAQPRGADTGYAGG
jgi:hypothetical protein